MYQQPKRIEYLDSIRGLAALAVLLGHSFSSFDWPQDVNNFVQFPFVNIIFNGQPAVAMFFVLSGFVLSRPYFLSFPGKLSREIDLLPFYIRRFIRIWLPWLFFFVLSALAQVTIFRAWSTIPSNNWYHEFWQVPLTWENFLRQCVFNNHIPTAQLLPQDWSLGVELKASFLLPVFIFLCRKLSPWSLLVVSAVMVAVLPTGYFYVSFIAGVLLAAVGDPVVQWLKATPLFMKVSLFIVGLVFYETTHIFVDLLGHAPALKYFWLGTSMGCVFILLASMSSRRIQALLQLPAVIFLGRISYSVYLVQFIVILCLLPLWMHALNTMGIHRIVWLLPLELLGSVSMTVGLSALTYRWG